MTEFCRLPKEIKTKIQDELAKSFGIDNRYGENLKVSQTDFKL